MELKPPTVFSLIVLGWGVLYFGSMGWAEDMDSSPARDAAKQDVIQGIGENFTADADALRTGGGGGEATETTLSNQGKKQEEVLPGADNSEVLPLEVWVERKRKEGPIVAKEQREEAIVTILQSQELEIEEERALFRELLKRYKKENKTDIPAMAPLVKRIILNKKQRSRLLKAEKYQKSRIRRDQRFLTRLRRSFGRGYPEIRICSVNTDNYGEKEVVKRLVRGKARRNIKKKERELLRLVVDSECSVLALQGLVGKGYADAVSAANHLAQLLSEESEVSWTSYVGPSNNKLGYNAVLVSDAGIRVATTRSYAGRTLLGFGSFRAEEFARGPFEVVLEVENRESGSWRKVVVLSFHFRKSLDSEVKEDEQWRMQMAETLRQLVVQRQRDFIYEAEPPIFVVVGDRGSGKFSPSSLILEGRFRLRDFRYRGLCKLVEKEVPQKKEKKTKKKGKKKSKKPKPQFITVAECGELPQHPKLFFGLISDRVTPLRVRKVTNEEGRKVFVKLVPTAKTKYLRRQRDKRRLADIYMLQPDLKYALINETAPLRFTIAERDFKYGLKDSPFLGVELNW
jgi:hypothetical protein